MQGASRNSSTKSHIPQKKVSRVVTTTARAIILVALGRCFHLDAAVHSASLSTVKTNPPLLILSFESYSRKYVRNSYTHEGRGRRRIFRCTFDGGCITNGIDLKHFQQPDVSTGIQEGAICLPYGQQSGWREH